MHATDSAASGDREGAGGGGGEALHDTFTMSQYRLPY